MTDAPPVVIADDLTIAYPAKRNGQRADAVVGASFELDAGEVLAVVGEAGSGKSTLAKTIAGRAGLGVAGSPEIVGGSLDVLGHRVRGISARKRDKLTFRTGYLPQDGGSLLEAHLTVGENVAEPIYARDRYFNQREAGMAVATLIDAVRLPLATMNMYPHELSRGQRQRVAIAKALILEPALLVADDPTAGIDVIARSPILDAIRDIQQQRSFSAFIVTADLAEVQRVSDRVAVMSRGMIVGLGPVEQVLANPGHEYVAKLAQSVEDAGRRSR